MTAKLSVNLIVTHNHTNHQSIATEVQPIQLIFYSQSNYLCTYSEYDRLSRQNKTDEKGYYMIMVNVHNDVTK